jgi:hypothetical protein
MKMTSGLIIGLAVAIIAVGVIACKTKSNKVKGEESKPLEKTNLVDNPYDGLRFQAINTTPEELQLTVQNDMEVYGIIMDWNMGNAIVTVTSFKTGDASIYMSTGQGFIGGIGHETVKKAAKYFVSLGDKFISKANKTDKIDPVMGKDIDFYFLTKSGKYYLKEEFSKIEKKQSDISELFNAANQVITEYRQITEKK